MCVWYCFQIFIYKLTSFLPQIYEVLYAILQNKNLVKGLSLGYIWLWDALK